MISDILYFICIYPLETILKFVLDILNHYIHSFGLSIILLSVFVNLFLLKLFYLADSGAVRHNIIKQRLDKKIKEFKSVFKGGELYAYIRTLYRQNNYHPIFALKALGGLALQVPFFIAVVFLLQVHFESTGQISFGIIKDLNQPDSLLFGINLLPLLMTFFTLLNVFVSSKDRGARIQGALIALVFLVLLYQMPSALLLYWTTSMVFAFLRSVFAVFVKNNQKYKDTTLPIATNNDNFAIKTQDSKALGNVRGKYNLFLKIFTPFVLLDSREYILYRNISIFIILDLCLMVFVYNPYLIYASDISQFDAQLMLKTLGVLLGCFLLCSFLLIYFTSFFYKTRLLKIGVFGIGVIFFIAVVYNFFLDFNIIKNESYGALDHMLFMAQREVFNEPKYGLILVDFCCGILGIILMLIALRYKAFFLKILKIFAVFLVLFSLFSAFKIITHTEKKFTQNTKQIQEGQTQDVTNLLSFSKEKNVLFLVLDAFTNSHFGEILELYPEVAQHFSGFTYFNNTISTSSFTYLTTSPLVGGMDYSVYELMQKYHQVVGTDIIFKEAKIAFENVARNFAKNHYKVDILNPEPADFKNWKTKEGIQFYEGTPYKEHFYKKHAKELEFLFTTKTDFIVEFINYGLFKISPYSFRAKLYIDYGWRFSQSAKIKQFKIVADQASDVLSFLDFANTNQKQPTFKYIKSMITHSPGGLDVKRGCLPSLEIQTEVEKLKHKMPMAYLFGLNSYMTYHFDNEVCAIFAVADFLKWMVKNGIYDQTKIIIASDHGLYDSYKQMQENHGKELGRHSESLLLFKDFGAKGAIVFDSRLMSNADAAGLLYDGMNLKNTPENILKNYPKDRKIIHAQMHAFARGLEKIYEIKEDSSVLKNWKDITEETLKNLKKKER
ncbi:YidC/Oxa1 family membrane protein insertase [Helicobacter anatolicus]|uniref:YidC/Oxa1 family membrane protein insertase n=1 Tax=Helicobacter anatolicus TaxID=2905874 RepID=UPI001E4AD24F|nr:YidC/Oxa1 family membrane protein insertase [Helicobacter anatolicus]MCE3038239.1 YidC/Oxa1 family membrane protein insertase [Helicobacter anatolicus]